jgi:cytochrome P450
MTDTKSPRPQYDLDNTKPELLEHLFESLNEIRETCPVAWSPNFGGFWTIAKYDDVVEAARDHVHFSVAGGIMIPPTGATMPVIPAELDPPKHTPFRKLVLPYFTAPALQKWVPGIREIIVNAFAPVLPSGRADLVTDVAQPVPVLAISLVLGMLGEDWRRISDLAAGFLKAIGDPTAARARALELEEYIQEQIDLRAGRPVTDIMGAFVNAEIAGRPITPREVLGMVQVMVVAGHDTTVNGIATLAYRVMTEPGLRTRLLADRSMIAATIEENLRLHPPVWNQARTIAAPTTVRDLEMCPGEKVMLLYGAANRDPERFPDPERFDPDRENNQHVSFGSGRHRCIGEPLAKLELRLALEYILDSIPDIELDGEPIWGGGTHQHGLRSLPVRFTPPAL